MTKGSIAVSSWRRRTKRRLVEAHGGKCVDCGIAYPPFVMQFDHRNPEEKSFGIAAKGISRGFNKAYEETLKCDLVCANCHSIRTHIQRCKGCEECELLESNKTEAQISGKLTLFSKSIDFHPCLDFIPI